MSFRDPQLLWLLAALPLVAVLRARRGRRAAVVYASTEVAREVARASRSRVGALLPAARYLAAALLIAALARPQITHAETETTASGIDMVLAVDVSSSMEALDMQLGGEPVNRLQALLPVVQRFIEQRPSDRLGLIAFARAPYLVSPVTLDHDWLIGSLKRLHTGMVEDGTAIGSALAASVNRLRDGDAESRVVILLTDGVNNAGAVQPSLAAQAAAAEGVKVYTIGFGSTGRAPVPVTDASGRRRIVLADVEIDEAVLEQIAETTGGRYFRATDTASLAAIYDEIDAMEQTEHTVERFEHHEERFELAALPAMALLLLELAGAFALRRRIP